MTWTKEDHLQGVLKKHTAGEHHGHSFTLNGETYCEVCILVEKLRRTEADVAAVEGSIHEMRTTYRQNRHAQEWADFILRHMNPGPLLDHPLGAMDPEKRAAIAEAHVRELRPIADEYLVAMKKVERLRAALEHGVLEVLEPLMISHVTRDIPEWRAEAKAWAEKAMALVATPATETDTSTVGANPVPINQTEPDIDATSAVAWTPSDRDNYTCILCGAYFPKQPRCPRCGV